MEYRLVGRSGLKVSVLGLGSGSASFAGRADEKSALEIIDRAYDAGITYFDTAETYAEGRAEELYGKALKSKRSEVIIATKFAKDRSVSEREQRGSRTRIMKAIDGSLRRLQTDYVDLYVMHEPDPETPIEETLRACDDLVRSGKVRYLACSDFPAWRICDAIWTSRAHDLESFVAAGAVYNMLIREVEREIVPCCESYGVGIVATMPLAQGFLTGKYRRGEPLPENARFSAPPPHAGPRHQNLHLYDRYFTDDRFDLLERLSAFAEARGRPVHELAISWLISRPWLSAVPVGVSHIEQLENDLHALEWQLSEEELNELDKLL